MQSLLQILGIGESLGMDPLLSRTGSEVGTRNIIWMLRALLWELSLELAAVSRKYNVFVRKLLESIRLGYTLDTVHWASFQMYVLL